VVNATFVGLDEQVSLVAERRSGVEEGALHSGPPVVRRTLQSESLFADFAIDAVRGKRG
jgi:hypothetical protein